MKRQGGATAALVATAPTVAHAYSLDGLYVYVALLLFAPPALLSLTAGLALYTYVKAMVAAAIVSVAWIAIWGYGIGARPARSASLPCSLRDRIRAPGAGDARGTPPLAET
jgi:hypothetical protein